MSRLIDADALIADLEYDVKIDQDSLDYEELTEINRKNIQFDKDCKQNAIDLLEHTPTADAVPVVHGHWIDMGDFEQCSVCKGTRLKEFNSFYGKVTWIRTAYCPHCGAKMDESTQSNNSNTLDALGEKVTE